MLLAFLRKVLEVETLPPLPPLAGAPRVGRHSLRLLVAPEDLPEDPVALPRPGGGLARFLFAPEPLPEDPPPARVARRRSAWGAWLLAPEPLPLEAPGAVPSRRTHWLAWLFKPEKLDP